MLDAFIYDQGLAPRDAPLLWTPLAGGVSSDIWRVDLPSGPICVKRALQKLKVKDDWHAPVSRNAYEWEWLRFAAGHCPDNVPATLAHDAVNGIFAMAYLEPADYPVWKTQLMTGVVDRRTAAEVGSVLGRLHAAGAGDPVLARCFDSHQNFYALRIEPYLLATARRHPDLQARLVALAERLAETHITVVHGDVSPKNILIGPRGPVIVDAECAWYGDPAFDLAFCLNHLLLKARLRPSHAEACLMAFESLFASYVESCVWESPAALEARAARLLPVLMLARVDGKSPVEYLDADRRDFVRSAARVFIADGANRLEPIVDAWRAALLKVGSHE